MKMVKGIPVYLLGLVYLVFGSNYFLQFIPMPPIGGTAETFMGILFTTKFLLVVKILEVLLAIAILIPKTRALGLILIAPITVNILLFELLIAVKPGIGILLVVLNLIAIIQLKEKYLGIVKTAN
jgi:hypothetical protein